MQLKGKKFNYRNGFDYLRIGIYIILLIYEQYFEFFDPVLRTRVIHAVT